MGKVKKFKYKSEALGVVIIPDCDYDDCDMDSIGSIEQTPFLNDSYITHDSYLMNDSYRMNDSHSAFMTEDPKHKQFLKQTSLIDNSYPTLIPGDSKHKKSRKKSTRSMSEKRKKSKSKSRSKTSRGERAPRSSRRAST